MNIQSYRHAYIRTCVGAYMHTYIHTYIHVPGAEGLYTYAEHKVMQAQLSFNIPHTYPDRIMLNPRRTRSCHLVATHSDLRLPN